MTRRSYRPWGQFSWMLDKLSFSRWALIGCLSTEERSIATYKVTKKIKNIDSSYIAKIEDPILTKDPAASCAVRIQEKLDKRHAEFIGLGTPSNQIKMHELFGSRDKLIEPVEDFINKSCKNIILDISTFPKRFFFPIIKILLNSSKVENIIATYSIPEIYTPGEMAEDYEEWRTLPLFEENFPPKKNQTIFVGAGHMAMSLAEQIEDAAGEVHVRVFIPFPGIPHSINRVWNFVRNIEKNLSPGRINLKRVYARDVPEVFEYIASETEYGQKTSLFAPYGPKPISLAMCLFSCLTDSPVYYTQPRIYHPDYSVGIAKVDNEPIIYAYCLRINGNNLYSLN